MANELTAYQEVHVARGPWEGEPTLRTWCGSSRQGWYSDYRVDVGWWDTGWWGWFLSTMGAIKLSEQDQKKPTSWQKSPCTRVSYLRGHDVGMPRLARGKSPDAPEAKQTEMTAVRDITIFWDIPPMHWLALSGPRKSIQVCSGPVCLMSQKKHPKQILALAVV